MRGDESNGSPTGAGGADIHNHLMPGVDDGAAVLDDARTGLAAFRDDGVTLVVTTPHIQGSLTRKPAQLARRMEELDAAWSELESLAVREFRGIVLRRGTEVMLDVPDPVLDDERLRLAGGTYVLVEFPYMNVPPRAAEVLARVRMQGYHPVLAHPERYGGLTDEMTAAAEWRRAGALLQVNAGSLTGRYGNVVRRASIGLLEQGLVDVLASDYHCRGGTGLSGARAWLEENDGEEQAELLLEANPRLIADGEDPLPVPPLRPRRGLLSRLGGVFR